MDFIADRNALMGALKAAAAVPERDSGLPLLLTATENGVVTVASTDLNMVLTQSVDAKVGAAGQMALNAKKVSEVVSKFRKGDVSFREVPDDGIEVKSGTSKFKLAALDARAFPLSTDKGKPIASVKLPAADLAELVKDTIFSASLDYARHNLAAIYFCTPQKGTLRLVSTDGHRLSFIDREIGGDFDLGVAVIVPRKAMEIVLYLLKGREGNAKIDIDSLRMILTVGRAVMAARLAETEYPDYRGVIPKSLKYEMEVDARAFEAAVGRIALGANSVNRGIDIAFGEGQLLISAETPIVEGEEIVPATGDAPNITVTLDSAYVKEALAVIGRGRVKLKLNDNIGPMVVLSADLPNLFHMIMPQQTSEREKKVA